MTMLRRPQSLVLSQYSFVRRTPGHRHHGDARSMSLEQYLASGLAQEMNNSQTRALVGAVDVPYGSNPAELLEQPPEIDAHMWKHADALVSIEAPENTRELTGLPVEKLYMWSSLPFALGAVVCFAIWKLNEARLQAHPELKAAFAKIGISPRGTSPEEGAAFTRSEYEKWKKVIVEGKIKPE